ncbi:hypothetical protein Ppb6_00602 [Photorhabdus australis subsp. thailandensis]|uniref:Uncharacterized protein n=1 Tax=Photorhabdus australis subsp. thailandensis TaxID=2805096 RepID=A0A1C0U8M6_9GAMM|nr:hypothetical protein Ppb6_00602 [Photorhabdus australis subsp. thailandensis]
MQELLKSGRLFWPPNIVQGIFGGYQRSVGECGGSCLASGLLTSNYQKILYK